MKNLIIKNKKVRFRLTIKQFQELPLDVRKMFPDRWFSFSYLLTTNSVKTEKGLKKGYLTGVMYLAPHNIVGANFCPMSTEECRTTCLWGSGQLGLESGRKATISRSVFLLFFPQVFISQLFKEVASLQGRALRKDLELAIRLNGTSDLSWESNKYSKTLQLLMQEFPSVKFYDYTKIPLRTTANYRQKQAIEGYSLTLSYSGENWEHCEQALNSGCNVAAVFSGELPEYYKGYKVVNGDESDLRFLDMQWKHGQGLIVGLSYKLTKPVKGKGTLNVIDFPNFVIQ